ncbi:MAG: Fic family protein [Bacillota bacterium]
MSGKAKSLRFAVLLGFMLSFKAHACDDVLKLKAEAAGWNSSFHKECKIQDRFQKVREGFSQLGIDLNNITEYKALRFIDRNTWEKEKKKETPLEMIYEPAPETWQVWSSGIADLTRNKAPGFLLSEPLDKDYYIHINLSLINDHIDNTPNSSVFHVGVYRHAGQEIIYCQPYDAKLLQKVSLIQQTNQELADRWLAQNNIDFKYLVQMMGYPQDAAQAQLGAGMSARVGSCENKDNQILLSYANSKMVIPQIQWLTAFIKYNLQQYRNGNPSMAPIELSALVQRWFVSIHPFTDGNGRTSRALQDLILLNFDMPFVPAGDLQQDALVVYSDYIDATYKAYDRSLASLEGCLKEYKKGKSISYKCQLH